jgi:hypothetical protein
VRHSWLVGSLLLISNKWCDSYLKVFLVVWICFDRAGDNAASHQKQLLKLSSGSQSSLSPKDVQYYNTSHGLPSASLPKSHVAEHTSKPRLNKENAELALKNEVMLSLYFRNCVILPHSSAFM